RRKEYVAPVKLYIFISFFVFFVGGIINNLTDNSGFKEVEFVTNNQDMQSVNLSNDSLAGTIINERWPFGTKEKTLKEYDSIQNNLPDNLKDKGLDKIVNRKEVELKQKYSVSELWSKIFEVASKNIPKFLFFYMPVFAFFMWVFHSKKKWYYFDHGIFTLHYFSFLLISSFLVIAINTLNNLTGNFLEMFNVLSIFTIYTWTFFYFFLAHKRVYQYSKTATILRGLFLFGLNLLFIIFGILLYMFIIFYLT